MFMFSHRVHCTGPTTVIFSHNPEAVRPFTDHYVLGISIHHRANVITINGTRTQNVISCPFQNIHAEYLH